MPSYAEEVEQHFTTKGWMVDMIYMGQAPKQDLKYNRIKDYLQNKEQYPLQIMINQDRCAVMVLAMDQTGALETDEGTKKDKRKERDMTFPQEQATHIPDCFDQVVWAVNEKELYPVYMEAAVGLNGLR